MAFKVHRITRYTYKFDARIGGPGGMQLFDDTKQRALIEFVADMVPVPSPTFTADLESATVYFRMSMLPMLLDLLRNEAPVSLTINNQPPGFVFLHTGMEPVGVGDEKVLVASGHVPA